MSWLTKTSGKIAVYRGVDQNGWSGLKVTPGGVWGDGVYFYTDPHKAKSHATFPGGGVLTGYVESSDPRIERHGEVVVVKDVDAVELRGRIPLNETTLSGLDWEKRVQQSLSEQGQ